MWLLEIRVKGRCKGFEASFIPVLDARMQVHMSLNFRVFAESSSRGHAKSLRRSCTAFVSTRVVKSWRLQDYLNSVPVGACLPDFAKE